MLELIYCPSFRPQCKETDHFSDLPALKYMAFAPATVLYLNNNILPYLDDNGNDEVLDITSNQKAFIQNNLIRHVQVGMLPIF